MLTFFCMQTKCQIQKESIDNFSFAGSLQRILPGLARMFHELLSRDREDGRATWQPQGVGPEAYLNGTSQGELVLSDST